MTEAGFFLLNTHAFSFFLAGAGAPLVRTWTGTLARDGILEAWRQPKGMGAAPAADARAGTEVQEGL